MFRQLNFRSFFTFLGRNKLYTFINIFGLSLSLMFVVLIADYTTRQLTRDAFHTRVDRIRAVGTEESLNSGYHLQKYLQERYPEIEMTCAVARSGWSSNEFETVQAGTNKFDATALYADSTFFRMFDFPLVEGDREQVFAARNHVVLSESFARKAFGTFNPLGQVLRIDTGEAPQEFVVTGILKDIDNSVIPNRDIILRAERLTELNLANDEHMSNAGAVITFVLVREGADLDTKIPDLLAYFKEFYWIYQGGACQQVTLTPLRDTYFSEIKSDGLEHGSWSFVLILIAVGFVILVFAVINYINLTVAQTGFRAREMAMRRLLGASRGEVMLKLILESTILCASAFLFALFLVSGIEPYVSQLFGSHIDVMGDLNASSLLAYTALIVVLGVVTGFIPAAVVSRYKPLDVMNGSFRRRTKMLYSNVFITLQNVITIVLIASSFTIQLQIRHLISAPLGYNTEQILQVPTEIFGDYRDIRRFRDELRRQPCVEAVALSSGTPHNRGNNHTMSYGSARMISFQILMGDSVYFRMLGLKVLRDEGNPDARFLNRYAFRELGISEDATNFKVGENQESNIEIRGIIDDFQIGSALDEATSLMVYNVVDYDRNYKEGEEFTSNWPWEVLIKVRGDEAEAFETVRRVYQQTVEGGTFHAEYMEQEIRNDYAEQQRLLRIIGVFTLVGVLISALGLLAMSTYYIQQKQQEVAVRKVFGSTRQEILSRLVGYFMRQVGIAFVIAVPISWYILSRWLEDYSVRITLSPLIFLVAGLFVAVVALLTVYRQSRSAANANPVNSIKN